MKKKIPALRFPEFEREWERKRIGEITDRISDPVNVENEKLYQQIGIRSHGKGLFHKELVTGKSLGNKRVFWVKKDMFIVNIVFAWEQAVAKTTKAELGMIASHRFPMYQPVNEVLYLEFILNFFLTRRGKYSLEMASPGGAGRNKTLGQKEFERLMIILPGYREQQKIVDILTAVDDKINRLTRKKTLLEQYKKGVMQKIFSQEIRFKEDDGKDFPEWEVKKLGEVAHYYDGTHQTPKYTETGIPFYSVEHVTANDFNNTKFISRKVFDKEKVKLEKGDILMTRIGDIGTPKYIDWDVEASFYVSLTLIKQPNEINSMFLCQYLKSADFQKELHKRTIHVAFPKKINLGEIGKCIIEFPCKEEQQKIADFLIGIDKKIEQVNTQLEKTKEWKRGLLQQMFV